MLQAMRKHARYFYFLFILVIISFIFWGVGTQNDSTVTVVAEIEGYKLTADEYWRAYESTRETYRQLFKEQFTEELEKGLNLKEVVLNNLIDQKAMLVLADEMGITVSDKELQQTITTDPRFLRDGVFRRDVYFRTLELNRIRPEQFENSLRQQLVIMKLGRLIEASIGETSQTSKDKAALEANMRTVAVKSFVEQAKQRMKIKIDRKLIT
jgi:peptidyl-prolyl cis-trans isomerase D